MLALVVADILALTWFLAMAKAVPAVKWSSPKKKFEWLFVITKSIS